MDVEHDVKIREMEHGRLWVNVRFQKLLAKAGLLSFEALYSAQKATVTKDKPDKLRTNFRLELTDEARERVFFLKRHQPSRFLRRVLSRLTGRTRPSPARIEWDNIFRLAELDIPTMTPVALGDDRATGRSFTLTEAVVGGGPLDEFLQQIDYQQRRELAGQLGGLVRRLHAAGLTHRDLYLSHVYVVAGGQKETVLHLIDLQRVDGHAVRLRRWCIKDVAQLEHSRPIDVTTRTDCMRFLHAYFGLDKLGPSQKRFVRSVIKKARRIGRHDLKLKGPNA